MKKILIAIFFVISFTIVSQSVKADDKLVVTASIFPLAHFADQVAGDHANVINITPPGAEPHEFEPSPKALTKVWRSKIFIFLGANMTPWAERIHKGLDKKGIHVVEMADRIDLSNNTDEHHSEGENHNEENDGHHHHHGNYDPHFWLDPVMAQKAVEIIKDAFIKVDPANGKIYEKNSASYKAQLASLHAKFEKGLNNCEHNEVVVSHDAFGYLSKRYGFHTHAITGLSPQQEPSPKKMIELTKLAKKENMSYIFFETLVSPKLAKTIAKEIGAKTLVLNPIGGLTKDELKEGKTYLSVMSENLKNLRTALSCK